MKVFSVLLSTALIFAQTNAGAVTLGGSDTSSTSTSSSVSSSLGGGYVSTVDTAVTVSTEDALVTAAKEAAAKQKQGKQTALIVMGVMAGVSAATCPACSKRGTCSVCTASLVGAAAAGLTAAQMAAAEGTSLTSASDVDPTTGLESNPVDIASDSTYSQAKKTLSDAATAAGATVADDLTMVTTPDGRTVSTTGAASGSGSSGLSLLEKQALASALAKAKEDAAQKLAAISQETVEEVVGGGGSKASKSTMADAPAATAAAKGRVPASVAGAFMNYNGEKIGVAADSVFEMMNRRYKNIAEKQDAFIQSDSNVTLKAK